jgi:magnesium chelatase family protein
MPLADFSDFADVRSEHRFRRALEIAAAGGYKLLLCLSGTAKYLLANRQPGSLPKIIAGADTSSTTVAQGC